MGVLSVCGTVLVSTVPNEGQKRALNSLTAEGPSGCELSDVGIDDQAQVLCRTSRMNSGPFKE